MKLSKVNRLELERRVRHFEIQSMLGRCPPLGRVLKDELFKISLPKNIFNEFKKIDHSLIAEYDSYVFWLQVNNIYTDKEEWMLWIIKDLEEPKRYKLNFESETVGQYVGLDGLHEIVEKIRSNPITPNPQNRIIKL